MLTITDVNDRYTVGHRDGAPLKREAQYLVLNIGRDDNGCASDYNALDAAFEYAQSIVDADPERAREIETSLVNNFGPQFALDFGEDEPSGPDDDDLVLDLMAILIMPLNFEPPQVEDEYDFEPEFYEPVVAA